MLKHKRKRIVEKRVPWRLVCFVGLSVCGSIIAKARGEAEMRAEQLRYGIINNVPRGAQAWKEKP